MTAYAAGLRVSDVVRLKVTDIDIQRMTIRIRHGKDSKGRYVMNSLGLLEIRRMYWPFICIVPSNRGEIEIFAKRAPVGVEQKKQWPAKLKNGSDGCGLR